MIADDDGTPRYIIAQIQDVTSLRTTENALQRSDEGANAFLNATSEFAVVLGRDGTIITLNKLAAARLGKPQGELLGRNIFNIFPEEVAERRRGLLEQVFTSRKPVQSITESEGIWTDSRLHPLFNENGEVIRVAVFNADITSRKKAEDELRRSRRMAAIGNLTDGLAHDFNNLLVTIAGNLEVIGQQLGDNFELSQRIQRVIHSTERAAALTKRLLEYSRQPAANPAPTNLNVLALGVSDLLQRSLGETIKLGLDLDPDIWIVSLAAHELENLLISVAVDAREAISDEGTLLLECKNTYLDTKSLAGRSDVSPGAYVLLRIKYDGIGDDRSSEIVEEMVSHSGGYAQMSRGDGITNIMVYFPRDENSDARSAQVSGMLGDDDDVDSGRILLVEDDPRVRDTTSSMLKALGYSVVDGGEGSTALTRLQEDPAIDVLLSDIVLPNGQSGPKIAAQAMTRRPGIKVLLMTGYADERLKPLGDDLLSRYSQLQNPFRLNGLAGHLSALLGESSNA